jgi:TonB family protein
LNRYLFSTAIAILLSSSAHAASIWAAKPQPKFPEAALRKNSEGYVVVRAYLAKDGTVTRAAISRSSGDGTLDEAARTAVLKWKMNAAAIKPEYLAKGYNQRIDFRQEAPVALRYRDRAAYFASFRSAKIWTYTPAPEYPGHERAMRSEGVVYIRVTIGADGGVASAEIVKSSGYPNLDKAALEAVRKWRSHREFAGKHGVLPVAFSPHGLR